MTIGSHGLIIIGENFNTTRKIRGTSPRLVRDGDSQGLSYTDLDGTARILDIPDPLPDDPGELKTTMIPHIGQAMRNKDMDYIRWAIMSQVEAGAHIIDICVDEMSHWPEERAEWMRWIVKAVQEMTDVSLAIDSSDSETVKAGLEVYDTSKSRPAINSVNLEENRMPLIPLAKEMNAYLFANAGGASGMPQNAQDRVDNLEQLMKLMDDADIPMQDRFLDPLVFPIGAGPDFGMHYLDAVKALRQQYPDVHIFGGHSNTSFGLPGRKVLNNAFIILSMLAGCDTLMIDPIMNPPRDLIEFRIAADAQIGNDEYAMKYLKYWRAK